MALSSARAYFGTEPGQVFACDSRGPVVVNARPAESYPEHTFTYLFWLDADEGMQSQAFSRVTERTLSLILHAPPLSVRVSGDPVWEMSMVTFAGILGQDDGGAYYLLRVEGGA